MSIVRYADDFVMGLQTGRDARQMHADLQERLQQFGLQLNAEKTRVIEFGRLPALARQQRRERRLGTFAFLGFTHYCGWTRDGRFAVKRKTQRQRVTVKLKTLNDEAKRRRHEPVRSASMVMSGAAGPLCLFRPPEQLPSAAGVLVSRAADLVPRFVSAESAAPHVDGIRSAGEPIPTTTSSYYASALLMMCCLGVTFAKSRMRESRPYGSVRAKPNGLATRPHPVKHVSSAVHRSDLAVF